MASCLIGYTGFLGGNLLAQRQWDFTFNRANIAEMGGDYELVVCAAAPGSKWIVNREPEQDLAAIENLVHALSRLGSVGRFVLVSTADVFGQPVDADERIEPRPDCAYGRHRLLLERLLVKLIPHAQIIRLPGVVGPGLRKNPYYDLQNAHRLEHLNPASVYQWYDVRNLWADIEKATAPILHLCPKPESLAETVEREFPHLQGRLLGTGTPARYNLRTIYRNVDEQRR